MKRYLAQLTYGLVERGCPILSWLLHSSIRVYFLGILCVNVLVICGIYGCCILIIFVVYMLVMNMFYDIIDVWFSSCFD